IARKKTRFSGRVRIAKPKHAPSSKAIDVKLVPLFTDRMQRRKSQVPSIRKKSDSSSDKTNSSKRQMAPTNAKHIAPARHATRSTRGVQLTGPGDIASGQPDIAKARPFLQSPERHRPNVARVQERANISVYALRWNRCGGSKNRTCPNNSDYPQTRRACTLPGRVDETRHRTRE